MKYAGLTLAAMSAIVLAAGADAATITRTFEIDASVFTAMDGTPGPVDPVALNFTVTFDASADVAPTTQGLTINAFNLPYAAQYEYDLADDLLTIGTSIGDHGGGLGEYFNDSPNSFGAFIGGATAAAPYSFGLGYTVADGTNYGANVYSVTASSIAAVPEPASWALMLGGFGMIGGTLRARRSSARFA